MKWGRGNCVMDHNHNQGYNHNKWLPVIWIMVNIILPTSLYFTDTILNYCILCCDILLWFSVGLQDWNCCWKDPSLVMLVGWSCFLDSSYVMTLSMYLVLQSARKCTSRGCIKKRETDWKEGHWTHTKLVWNAMKSPMVREDAVE